MVMRLMFVGDLHGQVDDAHVAIELAANVGVDEIIQVGDWGFIWKSTDQTRQVEQVLETFGMHMRFIDGNHDNHPRLRALPEGEGNVSPHMTYQRRGTVVRYADGLRVGFLGGAPSIDKRWRVRNELGWWPEELIQDSDVDALALAAAGAPLDLLVTHDAPFLPPSIVPRFIDEEFATNSYLSLKNVRRAAALTGAPLLVHGHYHVRYTDHQWLPVDGGEPTPLRIEGLDAGHADERDFCLALEIAPGRGADASAITG